LATDKQIERGISEIVGALTDPIIVMPGGWSDTLPEWIKTSIILERLVENMKAIRGEEMTGTDAEACAYLYTASLEAPMDSDWSQIYLHVATKTYEKWRTKDSGVKMPDDIRVDSLNDYQRMHLKRLKDWIYRTRSRIRLEHDRDERRQKKEEAAAKKKELQPALFDI
jgi:hypothetical protein